MNWKWIGYGSGLLALVVLFTQYMVPATVAVATSEFPAVGQETFVKYREDNFETFGGIQEWQQQNQQQQQQQYNALGSSQCFIYQNLFTDQMIYSANNPNDANAAFQAAQLEQLVEFWCSQF